MAKRNPRASGTCRGKRRYRDKDQALSALRAVQLKSTRAKKPGRVYFHSDCNGWHLTSQDLRSGGSR